MRGSKLDQVAAALRTAEQEATQPHGKGDGTADRIHRETGITAQNVRNNLEKLGKEGRAHIFCWTSGHSVAPVWVAGPGEHAPKPAGQSREEKRRKESVRQKTRRSTAEIREPGWGLRATYERIETVRQSPQTWWSPLESA
jgi:hypothetical protein